MLGVVFDSARILLFEVFARRSNPEWPAWYDYMDDDDDWWDEDFDDYDGDWDDDYDVAGFFRDGFSS